jgi:hypothetical protein
MRQVCAIASTLLGGVASADGEAPTSSGAVPTATATSAATTTPPPVPMTRLVSLMSVMMMGIIIIEFY